MVTGSLTNTSTKNTEAKDNKKLNCRKEAVRLLRVQFWPKCNWVSGDDILRTL